MNYNEENNKDNIYITNAQIENLKKDSSKAKFGKSMLKFFASTVASVGAIILFGQQGINLGPITPIFSAVSFKYFVDICNSWKEWNNDKKNNKKM